MLGNDSMTSMSVLRVGLVFFTGFVAFLNYYSFCHFLYEPHGDLGGRNDEEPVDANGGTDSIDNNDGDDSNHGQNNLDDDSLEDIYEYIFLSSSLLGIMKNQPTTFGT